MKLRQLFENIYEQGAEEFDGGLKTIGVCFGRFNPPHKGHKAVWQAAAQNPIWYVGTNQSTSGPKDPLPYDVKLQAMAAVWPKVAGHVIPEQSLLTLASRIYQEHGANVHLKVYTDEEWLIKTLQQYNGVEKEHGMYNFVQIDWAKTQRLASATNLRAAVRAGDRAAFYKDMGIKPSVTIEVNGQEHPVFDVVAHFLNKYPEKTKKAVVAEGEVVQFPKKHKGDLDSFDDCPKCGGDLQGGKYMGHAVKVCIPCKQVYLPPNSGIDHNGNKIVDEIAGAFPSPSTREKWAKDAAASNAAEAKRQADLAAKAQAQRLAVNTPDVERLNKVNYSGTGAPQPSNASWDGDSSFLDLDGTQYAMASRMPISGDVPPNMKLIATKEGRQVYIWTRNSLKGVVGRYFYPAANPKTVQESDKHSIIGKFKRGEELYGKVKSSFKDIGDAQKKGDSEAASKAFKKHERYANLRAPGTFTKVKEEADSRMRMHMIKKLIKAHGWELSDLELATDAEIQHEYNKLPEIQALHKKLNISEIALPKQVVESTQQKISKRKQQATAGLNTYGDSEHVSGDYTSYRLGMAVAGANGKDPIEMKAKSWIGKKKSTHPYTQEEQDMLKQAYKAVGAEYQDVNKGDLKSRELNDTHKVSPVAGQKKNKYGV